MTDDDHQLAERFEQHRSRLRAVAYRMLGSTTEADDAVQDTWIRLSRSPADEIENLGGWLATVIGRICLSKLRSRQSRREDSLERLVPDPVVTREGELSPEDEAMLADSVGLALLVVLDTLGPAERLAFVLHDMFRLSFDEIAPIVDRNVTATRQLASRGRRRVQDAELPPAEVDPARQREVRDAFFAASRSGDLDALVAVLDPDVVLRTDFGAARPAATRVVRGAAAVADQAHVYSRGNAELSPVLVNGSPGVVVVLRGRMIALIGFTIAGDKIVAIDAIGDPDRVRRLVASP